MMNCAACGDSMFVYSGEKTPWGSPVRVPCYQCNTEHVDWNVFQQQVYVRNLKQFVGYVDWDKQLLEFGISYDEFTCAKCYIADKCRSAFDSYNTNGDCLEEK